jgi:hypothetical protein
VKLIETGTVNSKNLRKTMKTVTSSTSVVSAPETTDAQSASAMFILKEQNGGTNGSVSPNVKSFSLKRNGVRNEEQENDRQVLQQKSATLPTVVSDSKKKITLSKKGKALLLCLRLSLRRELTI